MKAETQDSFQYFLRLFIVNNWASHDFKKSELLAEMLSLMGLYL